MPNNGDIPVVIAATETLIEIKDAAIATVTKDEEGNVIVHTTDGQEKKLDKGESYSVVDELGNGYVVDKDGNVTKTTATEAKAAHDRGNRNYNLVLRFEKGDGAYGFDDLPIREPGRYNALASHYQQIEGQYIAWKAVTSSQPDAITVIPENTSMTLSGIRFEVNASTLQPQNNGGTIKLSVQGKAAGMVEELIASAGNDEQTEVLGKLNLVSYDQLNKKVVIVPVNNAQLPSSLTSAALTEKLTTIFSQAVVSVQVKIDPKITVTHGEEFDDGESGMLSNYTGDMKKVINAYGRLENETYYLFLVENPRSGNTALGYMPRSKQAGFIFVANHGNNPEHLVRTMAHELSHGMFNLKHTFSEYSSLSRGATENLMDYTTTGTELLKYQWDYVHDPQIVIPLFEGDSEGAAYSWSGTLVDEQHTELFDHVYENNHIGKLNYLTEIERLLKEDPSKQTMDLNYDGDDDHKEWVNSWKIRVSTSEVVLNNTIKVIQDAKKGEKLGKIYLRPNHIYIAKYKYNDRDYPIAIYNGGPSGEMDKVFTKVKITDMDQLKEEENNKRVYIEETFFSYFIVAFYEDGKNTPTLLIQVEKFPFSDLMHNSMEEWLKFLKILVEEQEEKPDQVATEKPKETVADNEEEVSLGTDATTGKRAIPQGTVMERYQQSSTQAVQDAVNAVGNEDNAACNVCARAAFYYMTGDAVLFPKIGSCLDDFNGCRTTGENYLKGAVDGDGSASSIVSDFNNLSTSGLKDYFDQETKQEGESYEEFWTRLQEMADAGTIIVGTYKTNHVFMLNGGGSVNVVNNDGHTEKVGNKIVLKTRYKEDPEIDNGDKYGFCFASRDISKVPRIIECGVNIKSGNAPLYGNMDYNGSILIKWYKYKK